ncbi:unnamed protein product, partial [Protopolystoma xenopodis]
MYLLSTSSPPLQSTGSTSDIPKLALSDISQTAASISRPFEEPLCHPSLSDRPTCRVLTTDVKDSHRSNGVCCSNSSMADMRQRSYSDALRPERHRSRRLASRTQFLHESCSRTSVQGGMLPTILPKQQEKQQIGGSGTSCGPMSVPSAFGVNPAQCSTCPSSNSSSASYPRFLSSEQPVSLQSLVSTPVTSSNITTKNCVTVAISSCIQASRLDVATCWDVRSTLKNGRPTLCWSQKRNSGGERVADADSVSGQALATTMTVKPFNACRNETIASISSTLPPEATTTLTARSMTIKEPKEASRNSVNDIATCLERLIHPS